MIISNSDLTFAFCLYLEIDLMLTVSKFSFILGHPVEKDMLEVFPIVVNS